MVLNPVSVLKLSACFHLYAGSIGAACFAPGIFVPGTLNTLSYRGGCYQDNNRSAAIFNQPM